MTGTTIAAPVEMPHRRPPRLPAISYRGPQRIFVTMCTFQRATVFADAQHVAPVRDHLLRTATAYDVEVLAYCFMPDHVHALLAGRSDRADAAACVAMFRQRSGYQHRRRTSRRLWQEGYFDRVLRSEDQTRAVVSYIVGNPVRAGLCQRPGDYPFSGSSRYSLEDLIDTLALA